MSADLHAALAEILRRQPGSFGANINTFSGIERVYSHNAGQTPQRFRVKNVWLNDRNYGGSREFATANIEVGPFSLNFKVAPNGCVFLSDTLCDPELRFEITTEIRRRVWLESAEHLKRLVARDREQLPRLMENHTRAVAEEALA